MPDEERPDTPPRFGPSDRIVIKTEASWVGIIDRWKEREAVGDIEYVILRLTNTKRTSSGMHEQMTFRVPVVVAEALIEQMADVLREGRGLPPPSETGFFGG